MTSVKCSESVFTASLLKARTQLADQAESYEKISSNVPEKGTLKQSFHGMSLIALASLQHQKSFMTIYVVSRVVLYI